jgi:hypothetical protein
VDQTTKHSKEQEQQGSHGHGRPPPHPSHSANTSQAAQEGLSKGQWSQQQQQQQPPQGGMPGTPAAVTKPAAATTPAANQPAPSARGLFSPFLDAALAQPFGSPENVQRESLKQLQGGGAQLAPGDGGCGGLGGVPANAHQALAASAGRKKPVGGGTGGCREAFISAKHCIQLHPLLNAHFICRKVWIAATKSAHRHVWPQLTSKCHQLPSISNHN